MKKSIFILAFISLCSQQLLSQKIKSPEAYFGHQMGAEGQIIDFLKGLDYYQEVAKLSDRIKYEELGKTTDGNPFAMLTISSPTNLAKLKSIQQKRNQLADPRKINDTQALKIASEVPAVVFHTSSIHSTEISTSQVVPELVHNLVTSKDPQILRMLDNLIILVSPSANPDGQVKVKDWYEKNKGESWEGRMPWQYHTYVGHDNNRDWVLLHFPEQRLTAQKIHNAWHPVYSLEMHQMGGSGARIFVPPYQDPYDNNTPPEVVETQSLIGMAMSHRLTNEGKGGVVKNAIYDLFTPARAFQIYRGTARVLTETASANFARMRELELEDLRAPGRRGAGNYNPNEKSWNFALPWQGGQWKFRTMVEYQLSANYAALNLIAGDPAAYNMVLYKSLKRVVNETEGPFAYVFPPEQHDPSSLARLLQAMQRGEVEVHKATQAFEVEGQNFASGSYIIYLRQPYGAWAKTLLEIQNYPDLRLSDDEDPMVPYDVTSSTLPLMMGVDATALNAEFSAKASIVKTEVFIPGNVEGDGVNGYVISAKSNEAFAVADALLDEGMTVSRMIYSDDSGLGDFYAPPGNGLKERLRRLATKWNFEAQSVSSVPTGLQKLSNPRIAIYEPWGGNMDAGWTRHVFEQYEMEFTTIRNADIQAGNLHDKYDIIFFPFGLSAEGILNGSDNFPDEYKGGIAEHGLLALKKFVNAGGTATAFGPSSMALIELLDLPIVNVVTDLPQKEFFAPGSLVLTELDVTSPLAYGMPEKVAALNRRGPAFEPKATTGQGPDMVGTYPNYDPRLSGFLLGEQLIQGKGAIAVHPMGKGRVILFSMAPQFRAMTHSTYKLFFNAMFWAGY